MKNKDVAIALSLLPTGWFGAHKYYVGKKKTALLYLLFVWTMIPIVKSVFDGIFLLYISDDEFVKRHSTKEEYNDYLNNKLIGQGIINQYYDERKEEPTKSQDIQDE